jgi:transcriptional regulator with XRE-family HTH domain
MEFKDRLKQIRKKKNLSQSKLADLIGVHVTNISRYERGENKPTSAVLTKLGDTLGVSSDYLMSGSIDDFADSSISDKELLNQFKEVSKLTDKDRNTVKEFLDAFIMRADLRRKLA